MRELEQYDFFGSSGVDGDRIVELLAGGTHLDGNGEA